MTRKTRRKMRKMLVLLSCAVLLVCITIGATVAYLTDVTEKIENVFTVGNINIELTETKDLDLKMVPGKTIAKDPTVTVEAGSEDCWVFVKIEESANLDNFIGYAIADGWTELETGVYYREYAAAEGEKEYAVIKSVAGEAGVEDKVTVLSTITKEMMDALTDETAPTLTFTAYACQKAGFDTAAAAWAEVNK